ncbi:GroES-like protein [Hortaea werneckii]|uniref:Enoyl reductase (ER) domain-containing protein n=1 Tax=Hortaea werneckii TaxID=91943 RepID=A0A3M7CLP4_HORWE|nr:GroES-like protein [Hortaea werneckii]KAI7720321.1 GroES-like protein [Hortaea werneckii]RMY53015.1 hypothetical protein D0865_05483 [Hortaea werneckii]
MTSFKALRYYGPGKIEFEDVQRSHCGPGEVRINVAFCGICGSDIHEYVAGPIFPPKIGKRDPNTGVSLPITLGHEISGTITEVGYDVTDFKVGQAVTLNPSLNDRHYGLPPCLPCARGKQNLCQRMSYYGFSAEGGGLASEIVVKTASCFALPDGVSLEVGALVEPLAIAWHSVRSSGFQRGQTALVLGAGPIGLAIVMLLRYWGTQGIVVSEITPSRSALARQFGADEVVNPLQRPGESPDASSNPVVNAARTLDLEGVDVVFDATGLQSTLDTAIAAVKPAGTIYNVAIHEKPLLLNLNDLSGKEVKLLGGINCVREDFEGVLGSLATGSIPAQKLITSVVPLDQAVEKGFLELINNKSNHVKILIRPD